jgi:hypothetical protein
MTWNRSRRAAAIVAASVITLVVGACGSSSSSSTTKTATSVATANTAAPAVTTAAAATATSVATSAAAAPAPAGASTSGGVAEYQPSTVISKSASATVLSSPDSVDKVGAFYKDALAKDGWTVTSAATSPYSASFSAHRDSQGVNISIYPRGSGSGISITTHPQ